MIELTDLHYLVAVKENGTLSAAAETLHISQPVLTRVMKKLEDEFGVPLFIRRKNKLSFNENGELAARQARKLVEDAADMVALVRAHDQTLHTISIGSCAPLPMISLIRKAAAIYPDRMFSPQLREEMLLPDDLLSDRFQIIVVRQSMSDAALFCAPLGQENLFVTLSKEHPLAESEGLYLQELDGESMLLFSEIGFWHDLPAQKMPHSRFLVQNERYSLEELMNSSNLPSFVTDESVKEYGLPKNRSIIPVLDPEAHVQYYAVCKKEFRAKLEALLGARGEGLPL